MKRTQPAGKSILYMLVPNDLTVSEEVLSAFIEGQIARVEATVLPNLRQHIE
ncbi:hypothetical protein [Streptohalobacillus salinus]|uniref:hypothetical protein n=1 Tax=Streptohalobacillus salinus TaxID=621096 RepID=UPI001476270D|nr:hypothetical protein [Streptohalobacillus salinus]